MTDGVFLHGAYGAGSALYVMHASGFVAFAIEDKSCHVVVQLL